MKTNAKMASGLQRYPLWLYIVLAVVMLVGIGAWAYQLMMGHRVTDMSNMTYWGVNITMFMFFVGLSAGGLIVASSAHVFNIESFKKVALPAVITSTVCICLAAGYILVDLGSIQRIFQMIITPNLMSPLVWDMTVIALYLIINVIDIVFIVKGDERKVTILSRIALPVAVLVHSVTAWIFSLQIGHMWYTAIMAPIFVVSALDSGMALLLLALLVLKACGMFAFDDKLMKSLSGLLAVFVAIDAYLVGCELLTMAYPGGPELAAFTVLTTGATAPFFWFEIIGGLLIPFLILVFSKNREKKGLVIAASVLVVLGVLCKRIWLLFTAFIAPYAEPAPMTPDYLMAQSTFSPTGFGAFYTPTLPEVLILFGVIALGLLGFMVLSEKLCPLAVKETQPKTVARKAAAVDSQLGDDFAEASPVQI